MIYYYCILLLLYYYYTIIILLLYYYYIIILLLYYYTIIILLFYYYYTIIILLDAFGDTVFDTFRCVCVWTLWSSNMAMGNPLEMQLGDVHCPCDYQGYFFALRSFNITFWLF